MSVLVRIAEDTEKDLVHGMDQYYLYEFSRYMPDFYKLGEDGLFHDGDYLDFWDNPNKFPYLISYDREIAGFAMVENLGSRFLLAQFFVMLKFQGTGVARTAAFQLFDMHRGNWLVESLIANPKSEAFWPRTIDTYTSGRYDKSVGQPRETHHEYSFSNVIK